MTDAREIISKAFADEFSDTLDGTDFATKTIEALTAAGFRILGPDEVGAIDRLMARADAWPLNSDSARVSVRLGDLRALGRKA